MTFENYYVEQSGKGVYEGPLWQDGGAIRGFAGRELQYGNGFGAFGRMLMRLAKPVLSYWGRQGLKAGVNIGSDVLGGESIKTSAKNRLKESGAQIADDAAAVVKKKLTGKGQTMARRRRLVGRKRTHKRASIGRKRAVRRRRVSRKRSRKSLKDIFT